MMVIRGTASNTPTGPHNQPQKKMDTKMTTGLIAMRKPWIQGSMKNPTVEVRAK